MGATAFMLYLVPRQRRASFCVSRVSPAPHPGRRSRHGHLVVLVASCHFLFVSSPFFASPPTTGPVVGPHLSAGGNSPERCPFLSSTLRRLGAARRLGDTLAHAASTRWCGRGVLTCVPFSRRPKRILLLHVGTTAHRAAHVDVLAAPILGGCRARRARGTTGARCPADRQGTASGKGASLRDSPARMRYFRPGTMGWTGWAEVCGRVTLDERREGKTHAHGQRRGGREERDVQGVSPSLL
ncbi:hypothetical protein TRVL_03671 [Trypanosoma vivax]|nr:hypothetical protein TRVL_03671 [Trypanosoma vivax]